MKQIYIKFSKFLYYIIYIHVNAILNYVKPLQFSINTQFCLHHLSIKNAIFYKNNSLLHSKIEHNTFFIRALSPIKDTLFSIFITTYGSRLISLL